MVNIRVEIDSNGKFDRVVIISDSVEEMIDAIKRIARDYMGLFNQREER